jgi:SOS regulatory protein LexA
MEKDAADMRGYGEKIQSFFASRGRMPSFSELMSLWGFKTKSAVNYRVEQLLDAGLISKDRSGRLIPQWETGVKLLGLVEAGFPSPAEEELLDVMDFDEYLTPNKDASYILKVKGDSMIDAGIQPGDMVIVERKNQYKPGAIVIANVDGEYTMKYLRKDGDTYFLEPANKKYKPIYPAESFRIEAVVTAVVRKY